MSEELVGRARGRARGRSRLQPSTGPEPRRPAFAANRDEPQQPPQQQQLLGRARGARSTESYQQIAKLSQLTLHDSAAAGAAGGNSAGAVLPSRGGIRTRRFDEPLVTRPASLTCKQGTSGDIIKLKSNYFQLKTHTDCTVQQYRVDFSPEEDRTVIRKALLRVHKELLQPYVFDGTVLFTFKDLPENLGDLYSARLSDDVRIRITIRKTADLRMGDPHFTQLFNIVLRKCIAGLNLQLVGRDYYDPASKVSVDKHNLELWPGFVTSIRQHEHNLLLGVELANKIMRRDTALELLLDVQRSERWQVFYQHALVGATVITRYNNKTYRVDDIDFNSNPLCTFERGNERITYVDYYYQRYHVKITNMSQPLLVSKAKRKDELIILVPELCCMTGLTENMRNNFHLMRDLEVHTRLAPALRMNKLIDFKDRLTTNPIAKEELTLWNLKFAPDLVELTGRIFLPEKIVHGSDVKSEVGREADWTRNLRDNSLYRPKELHSWTVIYVRKMQRDVKSFVNTLTNASASLQFRIPPPSFEEINDDRSGSYVQAIELAASRRHTQLIMCIVPNNKADRYSAIKKKCCVDRAIPSQVVLAKNLVSKNVMSIATKIGIQLNCKIGGSPWSVVVPFKKPVMVAGFDVCHDSSIRSRSYGALVASLDGAYSRYYSAVSPHTSGEELSNDLGVQMQKAVTVYRNTNGFLPPKIIFYRDGVGEGKESYVKDHEVEPLREHLQKIYQGEQLQLAFVIVSKRLNTRFFYGNNNPPPGTVVDDVVTSPTKYDFFLVSQSVRQGSVSPTSYNVIYDTALLTPDIMQKLSHKLTHLYFNWSGTVRVPAPVQYAHKLAFLCGQYLHRQPNESLSELLYFL